MLLKPVVTRSRLPDVGASEAKHPRHAADPPRVSGSSPLGSTHLPKGKVCSLVPEAPLLERNTNGARGILVPPGISGLRPCVGPTLKTA